MTLIQHSVDATTFLVLGLPSRLLTHNTNFKKQTSPKGTIPAEQEATVLFTFNIYLTRESTRTDRN